MRLFIFFTLPIVLLTNIAIASGGGEGVPSGMVMSQVINVALLIGLIYFFAGKTIAGFFADKKQEYLAFVEATSQSVTEAENRKKELETKLANLRKNYQGDLDQAKSTAEENYRVQLADSKNEALKIEKDSEMALQGEIQKAVESLRVETFNKSADLAEKNLQSQLSPEQQRAWNQTFAKRLKGGVH